ncbi:NusG domain II-containing protein [Arhodomonas aquaeolei]|uniref:NusG domain II-containing protein n=1 Tax=Arhodomonas aquaeolei TaxID=2369 RepID=UPI00037C97E4|nr:NusG domain II-containing protein [Arhodomonas aquaeolei]MCS4505559.1 NusG domain II-containing protein [Arhodomonas aquaeolei]
MSVTDGVIVCLAVILVAALHAGLTPSTANATHAEIWVGGAHHRRVALEGESELTVHGALGETRIAVRDGRIRVLDSPGRRKLCVHAGWLARPGETAVCLPNRVTVTVEGDGPGLDAVNQ